MSAAPNLPPDLEVHETRREPPRRSTWKRVLGWLALGFVIIVLLVVVGVYVLLHSSRFHDYVLRTAEQKVSASLGSQVKIQNYALTFQGISPTLDIYGLVINGADPYPTPPIVQIEHVRAAVRVVSLVSRTWYLDGAEVHHPVVQVRVDKEGNSNIPKPQSSGQSKSNTNIFDLGVRHAVLDRGEVYFNDRKSLMSADLHDLTFHAAFDPNATKYTGDMSYRDGHVLLENFNPIPHDLSARFDATPNTFTLQRATMRSGNSSFELNAVVVNEYLTAPKVRGTYLAVVDAGEFRRILKNATLPVGLINANGTIEYASQPDRKLLDVLTVRGEIGSKSLQVRTPSFRGDVRNIGAKYTLSGGNAEVRDIVAQVMGGMLHGRLTVRDLAGNTRSRLTANLDGVSLAALKTMVPSPALKDIDLGGAISANADATWGKTFNDMVARADANIGAKVGPAATSAAPATNAVPVNGAIHATYAAASKQITLRNSYVRTPQTSLNLNGTVSDRSALQVGLQANDLHELETVADLFRKPAPGEPPAQPLGLYGNANFTGAVTGTTSAPHLVGQLVASNVRVHGSAWRLLRTNVDASPSRAILQNGELDHANRGRVTFNIRTALHDWSFTNTSPFDVALNASQLNVADLVRAAGSQAPVSGTLSANVQLRGTTLNPVGQGTVDLAQAKVAGEPIQVAAVRFNGTGDAVHATANVRIPAGAANAVLTYFPKNQGYDVQLHGDGIRLDQIQTVKARNMQIAGVLNISANGRGTIKDPQLTASAQIPRLQMKNQTVSDLNLQTTVANHVANISLDSSVIGARIHGRGRVNITGPYYTEAQLDTDRIDFAPLVAIYAPTQAGSLTGATELHANVRGPLKNKSAIEAHITVPTLTARYKNDIQIGAPTPIHLDYVNGVLDLQPVALRGTGTDLQARGTIPVVDRTAPIRLLLVGTVDLRLAELVMPDVTSSGQLRFNINSYGARTDPNVQGQVQIVNANLVSGDMPVGLENGNGTMTLTKDRLNIDSFRGTVGTGEVTARGGVMYRPSLQFDMAVAGRGVRVLLPQGVRTNLSTDLALTGTTDASLLRGQISIDQLSFTPDFDLMSLGGGNGATSPPPSQGLTSNMQLQLAVHSPNGINVVSRQLSIQGSTNLNVRGTAAEPVILGRINLSGGDLIFQGNRYVLQGGTIDFVNPASTQPNVNLSVTTTIQQYNISMRFEGPTDHMRTSYTSDPALPPADIISLVAFGKTSEASAANPNPPGNLGAESAIASAVSGQVTNRVAKIAGISHLSVDPTLGGNQQNPGAVITIQQRVTSKIFVTFSTDVTSTQSQTIQLEYKQSPRTSFSATRDQNGGFGFDTRIRKTW